MSALLPLLLLLFSITIYTRPHLGNKIRKMVVIYNKQSTVKRERREERGEYRF
jgi:hypothetical protein